MVKSVGHAESVSKLKGTFKDKQLEQSFLHYDILMTKRFMMPLLVFFAVLYLLFIVPDYMNLGQSTRLYAVLINRVLIFILILLLYFKLARSETYLFYYRWIGLFKVVVFASFLFTLLSYENPNVLIQTFGMMLIIISLFLVPDRWLHTIVICFVFILIFFVLTGLIPGAINSGERHSSLAFLLVVLTISGTAALRTNYYKRMFYLQETQLVEKSMSDPLTGCYNRAALNDDFEALYKINQEQASLILFDLDGFKSINDDHGHLMGDRVLVELVALFNPMMNKDQMFVRWGGEEFMVYLRHQTFAQASELAKKLKETLEHHRFENDIQVTASFGVASSKECENLNELLHIVDKRMYQAKSEGKNCIIST